MRHRFAIARLVLILTLAVAVVPNVASAQTGMRGWVQVAMIGFGVSFLSDLANSESCRTGGESVGAASVAGLVGGTVGTLFGALVAVGDDGNAGDALVGGVLGGIAGRTILGTAGGGLTEQYGGAIGDQAVRNSRSHQEEFEYESCKIIAASDVIRGPLVRMLQNLGASRCGPDAQQGGVGAMNQYDDEQWSEFRHCTLRNFPEARIYVTEIIRLNQATCRSIKVTSELIRLYRPPELGVRYDVTDPGCDEGSAAETWNRFVSSSRQR